MINIKLNKDKQASFDNSVNAVNGFVFATTGPEYTALAQRAAKTVRKHCPDYPVDLFTDQTITDSVFTQIHTLEKSWHRPKMECLRRARFKHTVYLDADLFVIADISDIFTVLERFDIAAAHDQDRNGPFATTDFTRKLPAAFPQYNSGVMGVTRNARTQAFLHEWEHLVSSNNAPRDQPILRELLFDSDLKICTLPAEYNLFDINQLRIWNAMDTAPRVLHHYYLHAHIKAGRPQVKSVKALLGKPLSAHVQRLISADKYLFPDNTSAHVPAFCNLHPHERIPNPFASSGYEPSEKNSSTYFATLLGLCAKFFRS